MAANLSRASPLCLLEALARVLQAFSSLKALSEMLCAAWGLD